MNPDEVKEKIREILRLLDRETITFNEATNTIYNEIVKPLEDLNKEAYAMHVDDSEECIDLQAKLTKARKALDIFILDFDGRTEPVHPIYWADILVKAKRAYEETA